MRNKPVTRNQKAKRIFEHYLVYCTESGCRKLEGFLGESIGSLNPVVDDEIDSDTIARIVLNGARYLYNLPQATKRLEEIIGGLKREEAQALKRYVAESRTSSGLYSAAKRIAMSDNFLELYDELINGSQN